MTGTFGATLVRRATAHKSTDHHLTPPKSGGQTFVPPFRKL